MLLLINGWHKIPKRLRMVVFGFVTACSAWIVVTAQTDALGNFRNPPEARHWLSEKIRRFLGLSPTAFQHEVPLYLWCLFWLIVTLGAWRFQKKSSRDSRTTQAFKEFAKGISILFLLDSILSLFGI